DGTLTPNPKRVAALRAWDVPKNVAGLRSLLGFLGYYQTYIPGYAATLAPLFELLRGHKERRNKKLPSPTVAWTTDCTNAVNQAIDDLSQSVLHIPLDTDEFLLETDASEHAAGAVLSIRRDDKWHPVAFHSKRLNPTQRRWPVREQEAFAIVEGIRKFDSYLRGRAFTVHTDHQSLTWMTQATKGKIARWASLLAEYDMTIYYKKGTEMGHIDFLSRFLSTEPDPLLQDRMVWEATCATTTASHTPKSPLTSLDEVLAAQKTEGTPTDRGFHKANGCAYYHGLVYVPPSLRWSIIGACHSLCPYRHPGIKRTKKLVTRLYNWPNIHADVVRYIASCLPCTRTRSGQTRLQGLQRTHPIDGAFERVHLDHWTCPYDGEHHTVLTMVCSLTKWAEAIIVPDATAETSASTFLRAWICRFGVPKVLVTDNGPGFTSKLFTYTCDRLGTRLTHSTVYHPEGNSPVEAFHRQLATLLRHSDQAEIPITEALDLALMSYRATPHSTTLETPAYMTFGQDPHVGYDRDWRCAPDTTTAERLRLLTHLRLDVQLRAHIARQHALAKTNRGRIP
ncbi:MAG: uncharacterized protein KVP18_001776, partial [Porospora cf. gigantea A]